MAKRDAWRGLGDVIAAIAAPPAPAEMAEADLLREFYHPPPYQRPARTDALRTEIQRRVDARIGR